MEAPLMDVITTAAESRGAWVGLPTWVLAALLVAGALVLWLVAFDNGQVSSVLQRGDLYLHELFHDGRHLIGVPCH
jgi:hypothetical protein